MRRVILFVISALLSVSLFGAASLTGSCGKGGTYPACVGGEVVFTGSGYPERVHVRVVNSSGQRIDDGDYNTRDGRLSFTENLSFADTYTVYVDDVVRLTVTTQ